MSITLSASPDVIHDVRCFAERHSTSLNAIIREHLEMIAAKERSCRADEAARLRSFFENESGWFDRTVNFDRELANSRS